MSSDIWLGSRSGFVRKDQCSVRNEEYAEDMEMLEKEIEMEAEHVFRNAALNLITKHCKEYNISETYRVPKPLSDIEDLKNYTWRISTASSEIQSLQDSKTGDITGFVEVYISGDIDAGDSRTSMSLNRTPDLNSTSNFMGSASNVPFFPGGFEEDIENVFRLIDISETADRDPEEEKYLDFTEYSTSGLLFTAPGLTGDGLTLSDINVCKRENFFVDNLTDLFQTFNVTDLDDTSRKVNDDSSISNVCNESEVDAEINEDIEKLVVALDKDKPCLSREDGNEGHDKEYAFAHVLDTSKSVPEYEKLRIRMARKYPFELDPFQQQAVICLDRGDSVFVAAHTSAGKTVVAEYAVALCDVHKTRAIYTSPIKALSNQKFREFKYIFEDVGLVTGDIQLRPEAFCLIMTTEVLRCMLYNGSEVIRELEWVIFDEVHYVNDTERGHVWEEVLIMLPAHVKIVMLSATVPNCVEFADWVGRIKNKHIYVITTARRPVPLEHFLYTGQDGKTKKDMFKIINSKGQFLHRGFTMASAAKESIRKTVAKSGLHGYRSNQKLEFQFKNIYITVIDHLRMQGMLPVIVFIFSRRRCDENAYLLRSVDLTSQKEKSDIHHFFSKCIERLQGSDKNLPQVLQMIELCKRGFAIHHSGILPILKEVVELLFQKGLVKVLFATETFAMGVNMPARTVIFDSLTKHDNRNLRMLNPGEYIQMAGRAGRRGLDDTGTVIVLCKGSYVPNYLDLVNCMQGRPIKLKSHFKVTYSMLLNLLRVEQLSIEDMLQRSYVESASLRQGLARKSYLKKTEEFLASKIDPDCKTCFPVADISILDYYDKLRLFLRYRADSWSELLRSSTDKVMLPGRLVIVCLPNSKQMCTLAVILKMIMDESVVKMDLLLAVDEDWQEYEAESINQRQQENFESCLMQCAAFCGLDGLQKQNILDETKRVYRVLVGVPVYNLIAICDKTLKICPEYVMEDLKAREHPRNRKNPPDQSLMKVVREIDYIANNWNNKRKRNLKIPGQDIRVNNVEILQKMLHLNDLRSALTNDQLYFCQQCPLFQEHFTYVCEKRNMQDKCDELRISLSSGGLILSQDYNDRINVLRRLHYIDDSNLVSLKGRVACEIHHQELIITELILDNKFQYRSPAEIAAMLSATTSQHKVKESYYKKENENGETTIQPPSVLEDLKNDVIEICDRIARVQQECGIKDINPVEELSFDLMYVVYEWANLMPFADIMKLTDAQEGLIVRCIQRLDELCRDVRSAARLIGDPKLYEKMQDTSTAIKRDIVFAASLYTIVD
ncbi:unnamed protein product [Thelazia callipaeda]|uniref:Helicase SKI2W n=1 Tax=Thelazia callipaeda TaxID=103827 RepID=A0A0N5CXV1_THECL|nr:unnamed protein product [Thelazia callipaeda]